MNAENVALSVLQRAGNEAGCTFQDAKRSCQIDLPWLMSGPRLTSVAQVGGCSPVRGRLAVVRVVTAEVVHGWGAW